MNFNLGLNSSYKSLIGRSFSKRQKSGRVLVVLLCAVFIFLCSCATTPGLQDKQGESYKNNTIKYSADRQLDRLKVKGIGLAGGLTAGLITWSVYQNLSTGIACAAAGLMLPSVFYYDEKKDSDAYSLTAKISTLAGAAAGLTWGIWICVNNSKYAYGEMALIIPLIDAFAVCLGLFGGGLAGWQTGTIVGEIVDPIAAIFEQKDAEKQ